MTRPSLEAIALRLDELSVDLELPELLAISEQIASHFGVHDSLHRQLREAEERMYRMQRETEYAGRRSVHDFREQERLDVMARSRYLASMYHDPVS